MKRLNVVLAALAILFVNASTVGANMVVNGGFETGDFTGWKVSGETNWMFVDADGVHTGDYGASFGCTNSGVIYQDFSTVAGQSYTFDFWLRYWGGNAGSKSFLAQWGYSPALVTITDPTTTDWIHYNFATTASASSTRILFSFQSQYDWWLFDDVSVAPASVVPIPGAIWLFGSGLSGLLGIARWRRRK